MGERDPASSHLGLLAFDTINNTSSRATERVEYCFIVPKITVGMYPDGGVGGSLLDIKVIILTCGVPKIGF